MIIYSFNTRKKIGKKLKSIRIKKKLTYYALGKISGLSIEQIQHIEDGDKSYTVDSLLKIIHSLDCFLFIQ